MLSLVFALVALSGPALAAKLSGELLTSGSTTVQPLAEDLAAAFTKKNPNVKINVAGGGSGVGIKDVAAGKVHIGNSSRKLKDSDPAGLVANVIGYDAVAVVVNSKCPAIKVVKKGLSKQQVKDIFTGKITNWKDVGGKNASIMVQSRTAPSGTLDFFSEEVLNKEAVVDTAKKYESNGLLKQAVTQNKNAIGFISLGYLDKKVVGVPLNGVAPSLKNAVAGKYHLVRPLIMVTKGKPAGLAAAFIKFAQSAKGQKIVAKKWLKAKK
ncbi:hypothetical protein DK28_0210730 [Peptococcaceae bacterium SCADC1_2_3]|nr:hypothetical protein DK28_0210730 [Peptococcaceae bacterium SCADC1_2_3]KFI35779.1 hypothetical protein HY00_01785 [Peptococcaceae bacterium SCADC1_2_3]